MISWFGFASKGFFGNPLLDQHAPFFQNVFRQTGGTVHGHLSGVIESWKISTDLQPPILRIIKEHINKGSLWCCRRKILNKTFTDGRRISAAIITTFDHLHFDIPLPVLMCTKAYSLPCRKCCIAFDHDLAFGLACFRIYRQNPKVVGIHIRNRQPTKRFVVLSQTDSGINRGTMSHRLIRRQ